MLVRLLGTGRGGGGGNFSDASVKSAQGAKSKAATGFAEFLKVMDDGRLLLETGVAGVTEPAASEIVAGDGLSVCVAFMVKASGLAEYHLSQDEISGTQRLGNLQKLVNTASLYKGTREGLTEFLEHVELHNEGAQNDGSPDDNDRVTLITFHNTKGLEFRRVIMTGIEHGIFPREDKKGEELEEERRLFYVGATRAMDELYLTSCATRQMYGRTSPVEPSVFLHEVDKNCLRIIGNVPYSFSGRAYKANAGAAPAVTDIERTSGWRRGQKLFHDDYGYGYVSGVKDGEDGPVVGVKFESGRETQFLSEHQASAFEKIGEDS